MLSSEKEVNVEIDGGGGGNGWLACARAIRREGPKDFVSNKAKKVSNSMLFPFYVSPNKDKSGSKDHNTHHFCLLRKLEVLVRPEGP